MAADDLEILRCLAASFRQDKYCDVAFRCHDGVVLRANRAFLAARSDFFDKMLYSNMREGSSHEIKLPYVSSAAFRIILDYLYTGALHAPTEPLPTLAAAAAHTTQLQQSRPHHAAHNAGQLPPHTFLQAPSLIGTATASGACVGGSATPARTTLSTSLNTQSMAADRSGAGTSTVTVAFAMPSQFTPQASTQAASSNALNTMSSAAEASSTSRKASTFGTTTTSAAAGAGVVGVVSHGPGGRLNVQRENDACLVEAYATAQQYFLTSLQKQLLLHMEALLSAGPQDRIGYMMSLSLDHGLDPLTALAAAKWTAAQNPYSVCFTDAFSGAAVCACVSEAAVWAPSQVLLQAAARWALHRAALHVPKQRTYELEMIASGICDEDVCNREYNSGNPEACEAAFAPAMTGRLPQSNSSGGLWGMGSPSSSPMGRSAVQGGADMLRRFDAGADAAAATSPETKGHKEWAREGQREGTRGEAQGSMAAYVSDVASELTDVTMSAKQGGGSGRSSSDSRNSSSNGSGASGPSSTSNFLSIAVDQNSRGGSTVGTSGKSLKINTAGAGLPSAGDGVSSSIISGGATASPEHVPVTAGSRGWSSAAGSDPLSSSTTNSQAYELLLLTNKECTLLPHSRAAVSYAATAAHERDMASAVRELLLPIVAGMDLRTVGVAVIEGIVERYCLLPLPQLLHLYKWQLNNSLLLPRQSGNSSGFSASSGAHHACTTGMTAAGQDSLPHSASSPILLSTGLGGGSVGFGAATTSAAAAGNPINGLAPMLSDGVRAVSLQPQQQRLTYAPYTSPPRLRNQSLAHTGQATEQPSTLSSTHAGQLPRCSEVLVHPLHLPPLAGQMHYHHRSSRYLFASDSAGGFDNMHSPRAAISWSSGAHGAAGGGEVIHAADAETVAASLPLPCPVQHPLLLPVLGSRMVSKAGPGGLSVVITNQSSPHQAARSAHPLSSGRHTFNFKVLTYSTFIWLGVVEDGCGVDSWPGTGPHGWLYGSNDALVNNHTDRCAKVSVIYERFLGSGEWQGIGHTVTMVVDMELRQVWFGPNNSELRLGFSHLPTHVYPTVSLQAGAAVEAWYC